MTPFQADSLRCFRLQLVNASSILKTLLERRTEFSEALPVQQRRVAELTDTPDLADDKILALVMAERKITLIFSVLNSVAAEIATKEIFLIDQLQKFKAFFSELQPQVMNVPEHRLPVWAADNASPPFFRAESALNEIDRLLETETKTA